GTSRKRGYRFFKIDFSLAFLREKQVRKDGEADEAQPMKERYITQSSIVMLICALQFTINCVFSLGDSVGSEVVEG
ncbi:hypothetical protein THAOC_24077, partial [Thalassiosira oceanica]